MVHTPRLGLLCLTLMLTVLSASCARLQPGTGGEGQSSVTVPEIRLEQFKLENGLNVVLVEDHRLPLVAVNIWYHVGPAHERPGRTGFAHLFEHMMFQGTKHAPEDAHFKLLEAAGASDINGTTNFDRTNYFETLPSNQLELALWLESDRMGFMLETLDYAKLRNQIDVVRNERRQSFENRPYGLVDEAVYHTLFPKGHPYYASIIGSHEDIESAELDDVREFFRQYYVPNNASLVIAGDIDPAKTKALVGKYFGSIPGGAAPPKPRVETPPITEERRRVVTDRVELPRVTMAWLTPPIFTPQDAQADLVAIILGGDKSSRLYKRLVYERQIAQNVSATQSSMGLTSVFEIEATAKPGVTPEALEKAIDEELQRLRQEGVTQEEVRQARNKIETAMVSSIETVGDVADRLNLYYYYTGRPDFLREDFARYARPTLDDLRNFADQYLTPDARVVVHGVPGEKVIHDVPRRPDPPGQLSQAEQPGQAAQATQPTPGNPVSANDASNGTASAAGRGTPDDSWRARPPAPAEASQPTFPTPQQFKLPNGLTVMLVEQNQLPLISANLVVLSGSDANPLERPGLAAFTADMLDEGTGKRSALEIADAAGQIGASLGTSSSSDASSVGIRSLKRNADAAFELLADVALNPSFPEHEITRIRQTRLTALLQQRDNPNALATRVFNQALYGTRHPYGFIELGTQESLEAITREEMVRFWRAGFTPDNAALVVAGNINANELRQLAEKYFGAWEGKAAVSTRLQAEAAGERKVIIVDRPGSPQTALRVGHVGVPRSSPDYVPLEVMNAGLGGLFSSRINMNLREQNGFTYGARSGFSFRRGAGPFSIGTSVRTDVTAPAIREIFSEVERMRAEQVSAEELQAAKDAIARSLPAMFETIGSTAGTIAEIYIYGLPLDYYSTLPAKIESVTAGDVRRVASEYLRPDRMVVVAVGDRSRIEPELRKVNFGPIEFFDLDARPAPRPASASTASRVAQLSGSVFR